MSVPTEDLKNLEQRLTGHCYVVGFKGGIAKIGITQHPKSRIRALANQGLEMLDFFVTDRCKNYRELEQALLTKFSRERYSGEYIRQDFATVVNALKSLPLEQYGREELLAIIEESASAGDHLKKLFDRLHEDMRSFPSAPLEAEDIACLLRSARERAECFESMVDSLVYADALDNFLCETLGVESIRSIHRSSLKIALELIDKFEFDPSAMSNDEKLEIIAALSVGGGADWLAKALLFETAFYCLAGQLEIACMDEMTNRSNP